MVRMSLMFCMLLAASVIGLTQQSQAQITYPYSSFESLAYAWTDAGDEFAYSINNADELTSAGTYTFNEYGSAPGYYSSASVGVEHNSTLSASGFHLTGKSTSYVADDYGYAACSANSEAIAAVTLRIRKAQRVTITGTLGLTGTSQPTSSSHYFEIRNAAGNVVYSKSNVGIVSYNGRLPAGTYTVYVSASVYREISSSGGDVYESSSGTYDVQLNVR